MREVFVFPCNLGSTLCYSFLENGGGLEGRDIVGRNDDCGVLGDVACSLFSPLLDDEGAEATEINVFAMSEAVLDYSHELLYDFYCGRFVDAGLLGNFVCDFCFCHIS